MTKDEQVAHYKAFFGGDYKEKHLSIAIEILSHCDVPIIHSAEEAVKYPDWAVAAVCEALSSKKFWKDMSGF